MHLYIASSWRNTYYPNVVTALREAWHEVYDFRNPPTGNPGLLFGRPLWWSHHAARTTSCPPRERPCGHGCLWFLYQNDRIRVRGRVVQDIPKPNKISTPTTEHYYTLPNTTIYYWSMYQFSPKVHAFLVHAWSLPCTNFSLKSTSFLVHASPGGGQFFD